MMASSELAATAEFDDVRMSANGRAAGLPHRKPV
jgi:hypothetical protein